MVLIKTPQDHQDMITSMQLSPDGSYLLTNGVDCKLCIWDVRKSEVIMTSQDDQDMITDMQLSPES